MILSKETRARLKPAALPRLQFSCQGACPFQRPSSAFGFRPVDLKFGTEDVQEN